MIDNPFDYTPGDVLRALNELGGTAAIAALAERLDRTSNSITLGLVRLADQDYVAFSGPPDARIVTITARGRQMLFEDDLLDRWN